jgi:tetratricopeptide (TPR) repeat protein
MSQEDAPRRKPRKLSRFLIGGVPLWLGIVALIAVAVTLRANILAPGKDWAESASMAAYVALTGAGVMLIAVIAVLALRRFQWVTLILSTLLIVALSASGVVALTNQPAIHRSQARALESNGQWQAAMREYRLAGEQPPNAPSIGRVHLEWGEQLLQQKHYQEAIDLFYLAPNDSAVDSVIGSRSLADLYLAYKTWLATRAADVPFTAAALYFERYLRLRVCLEDCQTEARELASQAWYEVGVAQLRAGYCSTALPYYRLLVDKYAETVSGQKASAAFAVPVQFVARVKNLPHPQGLHVWLSKTVAPATHDYITYFSEDYAATLDATGTATFPAVAPGTYNFSLLLPSGFHTYWRWADYGFNPYTERIGPLCDTGDDF